jgi:hypothetical protein
MNIAEMFRMAALALKTTSSNSQSFLVCPSATLSTAVGDVALKS